jgi:hypothetical protein
MIETFTDVLQRRQLSARTEGDCQMRAIRAANFLRHAGFRQTIYRRQGKVLYEGISVCCHRSGLHEWIEIPEAEMVVLDFSIGFRLHRLGMISASAMPAYQPLIIRGTVQPVYTSQRLSYEPDPYRLFKGVWDADLDTFGWHPVPVQ